MVRHSSWLLCTLACLSCVNVEESSETVGVTQQAIWRGNRGSHAAAPALNRVTGGYCSTVLISPRLALTDQHCDKLLPITDSSGTKKYSWLAHPQNPAWDGVSSPRVTWTWAPSNWTSPERTRDLRIIAFEENEAPLSVFPQRVRYFDSWRVKTPLFAPNVDYKLPVVFMGWGFTDAETDGVLNEQWYFGFGHELTFTATVGDTYRKWSANLGPFRNYRGPDSGDSGGPLFRQLSSAEPWEFDLLGLNGGVSVNAQGDDPRYSKAELDAMTSAEREAALSYNITYAWADLTHPAFLQELFERTNDTTRPGRLFGERDYYGPVRPEFDADGDHFYGTSGASCPLYLYDQRGASGALIQQGGVDYAPNLGANAPALHAYRGLYLNDRTRVYGPSGGYGTVVLGSHEASLLDGDIIGGRIGTDTDIGKLYAEGRGTLSVADRSNVRAAWWSGLTVTAGSGVSIVNTPEASVMRLPQSRFVKAFPSREKGVVPSVSRIAAATYGAGSCTPDAYCHVYQSIEPGKTVSLVPGYYGDVALKSTSSLTLTGGDYFFDALSTESGSFLSVASGASARVWVRDSMTLRNYGNIIRVTDPVTGLPIVSNVTAAANLLIGYYGLNEASIWELTGTVLAPYAKVTLETNRSWATAHAGMVIANQIEMHQGNSFYHVPYQCR